MTSLFAKAPKADQKLAARLFIGALTAVGMVAWAGCSQGDESRYYCDSDGCYSCDAYGCSNVTPPAHAACTGTSSCPPGQVCTVSGCAVACTDDAACPKGEVCRSNICTSPTTPPPATKECTTKTDCGDGKTCVGGKCQACGGTAGPCPCTTKSDCSNDYECVAGSCTPPTSVCRFSSECGPGRICANGQCVASCGEAPCTTGFTCVQGVCKPNPPTGCTGDTECGGETPKCVNGGCVKPCVNDPECGEGKYCNQGVCAVDTRPKPNCTVNEQCTGGGGAQRCLRGFCKYTCENDQTCRSIDSRIGYCAKDGVCRTQSEAAAACVGPADCNGQSCIDNQCH